MDGAASAAAAVRVKMIGDIQNPTSTHPTHSFGHFLPSRAELFGIGASLPISEGLKMTARMCAKTNIMVQMGSLAPL